MENKFLEHLKKTYILHKGKIIGAVLGFLLGILFLLLGILKTMVIIICTLVGYYIGSRWDVEGDFRKLLNKILPPQLK